MIEYKRLPFEQYFIDTSDNYHHCGTPRFKILFTNKYYKYKDFIFEANYEVHWEEDRNVIQVHFEETHGRMDWITNFMFTKKYYESFRWNDQKITLRVHNGWAAMYKAVKDEVREKVSSLLKLHPDAYVEVIGWSLGSGQACLCAQDLNYNLGIKPYLYTFGSVNLYKTNIFTRKLTKAYLNSCCTEIWNFADVNDVVGHVVPKLFGFIKPNPVWLKQKRFNIFRLFNARKYHTEYYKHELYENIVG